LQADESDSTSSPYFYSNSTDDVLSESSPLNSNASSTLSPIEPTDFLFSEDLSNKLENAISYPFDSFEFNRPVEEFNKIGDFLQSTNDQKPARIKTGKFVALNLLSS
jgi:hypothetical protein